MAVDNFDPCMAHIFPEEGGFVNNPKDPGGATNLGVTLGELSKWLGRRATVTEVRALTQATAKPIYFKDYWTVIGGDALPKGLDLITMDIAVNSGPGKVFSWDNGYTPRMTPVDKIRYLDKRRRSFWHNLKTWATFGRGWTNREDRILAAALKMAGA